MLPFCHALRPPSPDGSVRARCAIHRGSERERRARIHARKPIALAYPDRSVRPRNVRHRPDHRQSHTARTIQLGRQCRGDPNPAARDDRGRVTARCCSLTRGAIRHRHLATTDRHGYPAERHTAPTNGNAIATDDHADTGANTNRNPPAVIGLRARPDRTTGRQRHRDRSTDDECDWHGIRDNHTERDRDSIRDRAGGHPDRDSDHADGDGHGSLRRHRPR